MAPRLAALSGNSPVEPTRPHTFQYSTRWARVDINYLLPLTRQPTLPVKELARGCAPRTPPRQCPEGLRVPEEGRLVAGQLLRAAPVGRQGWPLHALASGLIDTAIGFALGDGLPLIVALAPPGEAELDLGAVVLDIHAQRDDGEAARLSLER